MRIPLLVFIPFLCLCTMPILGQTKATTVMGGRSCEAWLKDSTEKQEESQKKNTYGWVGSAVNTAWLVGYLSGANYHGGSDKDFLGSIDAGTAASWMDRYCQKNKAKDALDGANVLIEELKKLGR